MESEYGRGVRDKRDKAQRQAEDKSKKLWERGSTVGLWVAAGAAVVAIISTSIDTQNTIDASNRGWVGVSRIEFAKGIDAAGGPKIVVYHQNVGKSPAIDIRTGGTWLATSWSPSVLRSSLLPESKLWGELDKQIKGQCSGVKPLEGGSALFPSATIHSELAAPDKIPDMKPGKDHNVLIIAPGCVTYRTMNKVRHTSFCQYATDIDGPPNAFVNCPSGNHAD
jgi:hypothetical protein